MKVKTKKITVCALFSAIALMFSYLEFLFPLNIGVPGIKLGIANLVVIVALYVLTIKDTFIISMLKVLMSGLLFTGLFGAVYSAAGTISSFLIMVILMKTKKFSIIGISMAGGVFHNLGQISLASLILGDIKLFLYFPVILWSGIITGTIIGIVGSILTRKIQVVTKNI